MFRFVLAAALLVASANGQPFVRPSEPRFFTGINPFTPQGRIVGGRVASIKEHPWQVSLQTYGFHFCGGSIISDKAILTAGHCTKRYPASSMTVRVGSNMTANGGALYQVQEILRHEDFRTNMFGVPENDVAILKLQRAIELSESAKPIALFDVDDEAEEGVLSTISGWGATNEGGYLPGLLHTVDVPIISKSTCDEAYKSFGGVPKGQICAAYPEGGRDSCQGDSGGPLVIAGKQAGIVSWGNGCARRGWPGVYSEVAALRHWIAKNADL